MADRNVAIVKQPIWMKLAEEAKVKEETEKAAAAKAAFDATFKAVDASKPPQPAEDSDSDVDEDLSAKPLGPVDPSKCSAAGAGIAGGSAGSASTFVVVTKDPDGRKIPTGGAHLKVKVSPAVGVGGPDQEGVVKDQGDGTYSVTYIVPKRGNYNVFVECNGKSIMGSPFPVFFSQGQVAAAAATNIGGSMSLTPVISSAQFPNRVNQTMPNMPNYAGSVSGAFPGLLGMMPGALPSASGGVVLHGIGASLGEICGEYLKGRCLKTDCKLNHPPHNLLMSYLAATTTMTMGTMNHVPMAPSAAAMAAAQAIVAAQTLQAHAAQMQAAGDSSGSPDKADVLKRTVQVSNLNPLLTSDQLKQLFAFCGTVADCTITDSKHFAFVEYSKAEEATAALAMNNMDVGGRPLNVEMAKTLPPKSAYASSSLPSMIQQAVAMQQMQFQQSLIMQQTIANQQAATRAATMKSATEMASARAAEISKKLKQDGLGNDNEEAKRRSRSPLASQRRSKSRSGSPIRYRRSRRSRSLSPPRRYSRSRRWSRSPPRSHYSNHGSERRSYRDVQDRSSQGGRREREKSRERYSSTSRRNRRSISPRVKDSSRAGFISPKRHRESSSPRTKRSTRGGSRSPRHHRGTRSSPARNHGTTSHHNRRSKSISPDGRRRSDDKEDAKNSEKPKHRRSISRSADGRHRSNNNEDAKMLEKPKTRSRSRSADGRRHSDHKDVKRSDRPRRRHSRSRSAERGRVSDHKDAKESEKLIQEEQHKQDDKKSDRNDLKDSRGPRESKTVDPPAVGHKRSTLLPEDEELGSETCTNNHKKSDRSIVKDSREPREYKTVDSSAEAGFLQRGNLSDDKDAKESEKLIQEEQQKQYNKISDRSDIKDSSDPSESMTVDSSAVSHKKNSFSKEDEAERSQTCMNHHKKHKVDEHNFVRIASVIENQNLGNKVLQVTEDRTYEHSPVPKPVKKSLTYRDDHRRTESRELRRHENFRPDKEQDRSDYADREREHVTKSGHSRDGRRASHHSSSRSHRSSRHLEDISHRDTRNHRKLDNSKEESVVSEDIDETANVKSIEEEVLEKAITTQEIDPMAYEHANFKYASELISHIPIIDVGGSCMEGENRLDVSKAEVNLEDASFDSHVYPDNNATCLREDGITEATGVPMSPCDPNNLISADADLNFD